MQRTLTNSSTRRALTLVEMLIVVAVLALLTSAVALTFATPLRKARGADAMARIRSADAFLRVRRASGKPVRLVIDLDASALSCLQSERLILRQALPRDFHLTEFRTATGRHVSGETELSASPTGLTPTYAIRIDGPDAGRWLLVAGLTGQISELNDEADVRSIFERLDPTGERDPR